jgi:hypothetical protein
MKLAAQSVSNVRLEDPTYPHVIVIIYATIARKANIWIFLDKHLVETALLVLILTELEWKIVTTAPSICILKSLNRLGANDAMLASMLTIGDPPNVNRVPVESLEMSQMSHLQRSRASHVHLVGLEQNS